MIAPPAATVDDSAAYLRFSLRGLIIALLLLVLCAIGARAVRLAHYGTTPLTGDQIGYFHHARSLNWDRPFYIEVEPMTVWLNLLSQQAGQALNLSPSLAVRLGTFSMGLGVVVWLFFLARVWTGDAGALLAGLFWALSPFVCVADVAGGRDTPYILYLGGVQLFLFCALAASMAGSPVHWRHGRVDVPDQN